MKHIWNCLLFTALAGLFAIVLANQDPETSEDIKDPPTPKLISNGMFIKGETLTISCYVEYQDNVPVALDWVLPPDVLKAEGMVTTNINNITSGLLFRNLTIVNATERHSGEYKCFSKNKQNSTIMKYIEEPYVTMIPNTTQVIITQQSLLKKLIKVEAYPPITKLSLYINNKITQFNDKYTIKLEDVRYALKISNITTMDTGNYTFVATNGYKTVNVTFDVRVKTKPIVTFGTSDKTCTENTILTLKCDVIGFPPPKISWIFSNSENKTMESSSENITAINKISASLDIHHCHTSGNITCSAINNKGYDKITRRLLVFEMPDGFGIKKGVRTWFSEYQEVSFQCFASIYYFNNVTWLDGDKQVLDNLVKYSQNSFSLIATLQINNVSVNHAGNYECRGIRINGSKESSTIPITVEARRPVIINTPIYDKIENVYPCAPIQLQQVSSCQKIQMPCQADGVPPPTIEWYKDGELLLNNSNHVIIINNIVNNTTINSTLVLNQMDKNYTGKYICKAFNGVEVLKSYTLNLKEAAYTTYLYVIAVIFVLLIALVLYLTLKIKKEKQFRKELAAAGLLNFKKGVTNSLNPNLDIGEQAELLPYDERFEFPPEKLQFGIQLGAGAFGVVYKAEARGIIDAEVTTTVAVKTVKKNADNMFIKALASELKIMVHLGKHVNIVNLLGACTKKVGRRELIVIVEYCMFGNIHNYMQRHRAEFIDQLTDDKEKNLGRVNRAFSCTGSSGAQSDYFASGDTQNTDHTFVNTANSSRSGRKASEAYIQPEWRSNYESEYSDGRSPRTLTSRDLLVWAFQIARGMEYLASRKVLHGDLAARNVLLAEDNIVKICDFGLAKSIYKNDEYKKQENSPLPVKWLAIECMTDRIFSTQSDVWSFGIVLWELFSLAKTPYPNISPTNLLQWLTEGHRLDKPPYADERIYRLMKRCWEQKPTSRPSFTDLQELLGRFLEDEVRKHYVELNSPYMMSNAKCTTEDYLAMLSAPDYNNLVTPSPHHYVNDSKSFFPSTPIKLDDEGYLQMSPAREQSVFSPRAQGQKFDFDPRKFNTRTSEASTCGSELTPMLTLSNLPARGGSESDPEPAPAPAPYLSMQPRDREPDDVFHSDNNDKNAGNLQNTVTNPTYIQMEVDEKPKDIINNYANINIPNGLVK